MAAKIPLETPTAPREEPAFLDNEGPSDLIPLFITTTNARELYGLRPDETVPQAMIRCTKG